MKHVSNISLIILVGLIFFTTGCIEELDIENANGNEGKGLLVVEASLNDKFSRQKIYLSRTDTRFDLETDTVYSYVYPLGIGSRDSVPVEKNANISVLASNGSIYNFVEDEPGTYLSSEQFALEQSQDYTIEITTSSGTEYQSEPISFSESSEITDVIAERVVNKDGVEGVQISLNSQPVLGNPSLYRYTYDETFKIIAPNWNPQEFNLKNYDPCGSPFFATYDLSIVNREEKNRICYKTVPSNTIIQTNLTDDSNEINKFPVRFIDRDNFIISHRYSIMVQQHIQSLKAYSFYATLKNIAESESVFSQIQPGSLEANVYRKDGRDEVILGYVEATSVSEKRIYFNYEDLFPGESLPPFPYDCREFARHEGHLSYCLIDFHFFNTCPPSIVELVNLGLITYTGLNDEQIDPCPSQVSPNNDFGPYTVVSRVCGDCTILGENFAPDFWVE